MRILQVNKYHYIAGGAEKYYFDLSNLLSQKGHTVAHFSMRSPENTKSKWSKYFVSNLSFNNVTVKNGWSVLTKMAYSPESRQKIGLLIDEFRPDLVHLHNIYFHISPSILLELKKRSIPVVMTLHDYNLITPNVTFFHGGKICEISRKRKFYRTIFHRCVKNSYFASFLAASALQIHRSLRMYEGCVDAFIAPSLFMKKKMTEYGFDAGKIYHLPNFVSFQKKKNLHKGEYVFYFGSFYEHKGVHLLLKAAQALPEISFKIAGDGPEERNLKRLAGRLKLKNVDFLGRLDSGNLSGIIGGSAFCVIPSLWYENLPYSVLESFAKGKPVVASRIGGIPELVKDGKNGFLFEPGNVDELSEKIRFLWERPGAIMKMGNTAQRVAEDKYNSELHYDKLMKIYKEVLSKYP